MIGKAMAMVTGALVLSATATAAGPVTHIDADDVRAAFERGAPLLESGTFKIHASRRDAPGEAEIHELDSDLIHVLEGTATLVTGGSIVAGRATAPREIRGESIRDGEPRRLAPGDVVVVPHGTPHWFREVGPPFLYYVVKVPTGTGEPR